MPPKRVRWRVASACRTASSAWAISNGVAPFFVFSSWFSASWSAISRRVLLVFELVALRRATALRATGSCSVVTCPVCSLRFRDRFVVTVATARFEGGLGGGEVVASAVHGQLGGADVLGPGAGPQVVEAALAPRSSAAWAAAMSSARVFGPPSPARACSSRKRDGGQRRLGVRKLGAATGRPARVTGRSTASRPAASSGFGPASSASTRVWACPTWARAAAISSARAPALAWSSRASADRTAAAAASMSSALEPAWTCESRAWATLTAASACCTWASKRRSVQLGDHLALPDLVADVDVQSLDAAGDLRHDVDLGAGLHVAAVHQRGGDAALDHQRAGDRNGGGRELLACRLRRASCAAGVQLTTATTRISAMAPSRRRIWRPPSGSSQPRTKRVDRRRGGPSSSTDGRGACERVRQSL